MSNLNDIDIWDYTIKNINKLIRREICNKCGKEYKNIWKVSINWTYLRVMENVILPHIRHEYYCMNCCPTEENVKNIINTKKERRKF